MDFFYYLFFLAYPENFCLNAKTVNFYAALQEQKSKKNHTIIHSEKPEKCIIDLGLVVSLKVKTHAA